MRSQFKLFMAILMLSVFIIIPTSSQAQVMPSVRLTAPTTPIQAEVDRQFVIPLTITMPNQEAILGGVYPRTDNAAIRVEQRTINQILAPNATFNASLTGVAQSAGIFRVILEVDAAGFVYSTEVMVDVKDPDEAQRRPRFSITKASILPSPTDLDNPFTLELDLKNTGDEPSGLVMATLAGAGNFSVKSLTNRADMSSVNPGETGKVSFILSANDNRTSNEVTLTLSYDTYTQTETLFLPLPDIAEPSAPPLLKVESFKLTPAQEGQFALKLTIINEGESKAENISLSLDAGGKAFPLSGGNVRTIKQLASGAKTAVEYLLASQGELSAHPVNIAFEFSDENEAARKGSDRIFITTNLEPLIGLTGFSARQAGEDGEFSLTLNIKNNGLSKARDISVRFTGNQASPVNKGAVVRMSDIAAGASGSLSLLMQTKLEADTYTIPFEITYRSQGGAEHKETDTVTIPAESIGIHPDEQAGLLPVMIDRHTISKDAVLAGQEFVLSLYIKNTSDEPTGSVKVTLGEARAGNTGGSVFSTTDGRISFYAENIPENGEIVKQINLFADRSAQSMTYSLPVTIEYEDIDGKLKEVSSVVGIPVIHERRFRVLTLDIPSSAAVGEAVPVSMEFANTGRVNIDNVFISLEGDFEKENATFFIPSFTLGTSDFFHATLFPEAQGELAGKIVVTYDGAHGEEVRHEQPFSLQITPPAEPAAGMPGNPGARGAMMAAGSAQTPFSLQNILLFGVLPALVLIAAIFTIKKIKANRKTSGSK